MISKKIFISYCWKDEKLVDKIDSYYLKKGIEIQRDKRGIDTWESIKEFMQKISESDCAILVISSDYLKSINCMYEVLEVMKRKNFRSKICTIVLEGTDIYNPIGKLKYIKYWQEQHQELENGIRGINDFEITSKSSEELKKIRNIMGEIDEFLSIVSDMNNPVVNDNIYDEINNKLLELGISVNTDIDQCNSSTDFFDLRLRKSFPGLRGGKWLTPSDGIVDSLSLLLKQPLTSANLSEPIWWFKGSSCSGITYFEKINSEKCIIDKKECLIDKIYVYQSGLYYKSFIYVELKPEKATGIYEENSYCSYEEYGLYKGHPITRAEFDDGAAIINNKYTEFEESPQIRIRYLKKYNFIICAKFNPINSIAGDTESAKILKAIINGQATINDLVSFIEQLPKNYIEK